MNQKNIIKPANTKKLQTLMTRIGINNTTINDSYTHIVIGKFNHGDINITEKNQLLIQIILNQLGEGSKHLDGFNTRNACLSCKGKGFNVFLELELTDKCKGTHDCLPCNGNGIMTKICIRCHGITLNETLKIRKLIIDYKERRITRIPCMNQTEDLRFREDFNNYSSIDIQKINPIFISENGEKTFRVIQANGDGDYSYIQKKPCRACQGNGRFVYTNDTRTIKCPGCHGKGKVKEHLKSTNKIKFIILCNKCNGSGKTFADNPVLNIKKMNPEVRKTLEKRGLFKK